MYAHISIPAPAIQNLNPIVTKLSLAGTLRIETIGNAWVKRNFQFCAAAALGLTIYVAFGAVLGEANAAETNCLEFAKMSQVKILLLQQFSILCGFLTAILLTTLSPRSLFMHEFDA